VSIPSLKKYGWLAVFSPTVWRGVERTAEEVALIVRNIAITVAVCIGATVYWWVHSSTRAHVFGVLIVGGLAVLWASHWINKWQLRHTPPATAGVKEGDRPNGERPLFTPEFRRMIWQRDDERCGICGLHVPWDDLHIDHIYPWSKGGSNEPPNLQAAHSSCNERKGDRTDWQRPYFPAV
jgi:hypothetical protein